jgi:hypothetical protein
MTYVVEVAVVVLAYFLIWVPRTREREERRQAGAGPDATERPS